MGSLLEGKGSHPVCKHTWAGAAGRAGEVSFHQGVGQPLSGGDNRRAGRKCGVATQKMKVKAWAEA